ncbi:hypothetical protein KFL_004180080 [Klebsormidium nitens]|uniref:Uncharacterized protein n=1 Tax=Klebsormidium nitens TaxID=105231 RepID=A0A1Y1ICK2_KLENI|nr:hypothetical protein KFL_004180080 [Klebsormidium nitens]|eukprot:GAQ88323.1 hypothetical protein KFL_004180080 [Klebsormidium nitens]
MTSASATVTSADPEVAGASMASMSSGAGRARAKGAAAAANPQDPLAPSPAVSASSSTVSGTQGPSLSRRAPGTEFFKVALETPPRARVLTFDGIDNLDSRTAGTGNYTNTNPNVEPSDGGLCAGNGFVVQIVNNALVVFDSASGIQLTVPVAINQLWQVAPYFPSPTTFGAYMTDPRCVFDRDTGRFFLSAVFINRNETTGDFIAPSATLFAVTASGDPRAHYALYRLPTTNDGTEGTPNLAPTCPCSLDEPKLAVSADALIVNGLVFTLFTGELVSQDVYAMSKFALAAGDASVPTAAYVNSTATRVEGNVSFINVARVSPDEQFPTEAGGVVYFVSDTDFTCSGVPVRQLALFALVNTRALRERNPDVRKLELVQTLVDSLIEYNNCEIGLSPFGGLPVTQKSGLRVLNTTAPLELLSSNDDSVREPVFAHGNLFVGLNDIVPGDSNRPPTVGIAFFLIKPSVTPGENGRPAEVTGPVFKAGVIAVENRRVAEHSVSVSSMGPAWLASPSRAPTCSEEAVGSEPVLAMRTQKIEADLENLRRELSALQASVADVRNESEESVKVCKEEASSVRNETENLRGLVSRQRDVAKQVEGLRQELEQGLAGSDARVSKVERDMRASERALAQKLALVRGANGERLDDLEERLPSPAAEKAEAVACASKRTEDQLARVEERIGLMLGLVSKGGQGTFFLLEPLSQRGLRQL